MLIELFIGRLRVYEDVYYDQRWTTEGYKTPTLQMGRGVDVLGWLKEQNRTLTKKDQDILLTALKQDPTDIIHLDIDQKLYVTVYTIIPED